MGDFIDDLRCQAREVIAIGGAGVLAIGVEAFALHALAFGASGQLGGQREIRLMAAHIAGRVAADGGDGEDQEPPGHQDTSARRYWNSSVPPMPASRQTVPITRAAGSGLALIHARSAVPRASYSALSSVLALAMAALISACCSGVKVDMIYLSKSVPTRQLLRKYIFSKMLDKFPKREQNTYIGSNRAGRYLQEKKMLNQSQITQFRNAVAAWNCNGATDAESLADAEIISCDDDVAVTRSTIEEFFQTRGRKLDRHGNIPAIPRELEANAFGDLYVWRDQQSRNGARRGTLWVMSFGEFCAAYFDGEV